MSYIAFDLDAFDAAESVARHAGASADAVMAGLLRLWRFCWRQKTDWVAADQLRGVFGIDAGPALTAFGFVEPTGGGFRVKGASRYLRIQEGRSKGGRAAAAAGNLKRGASRLPAASQLPPSLVPAEAPADSQAFTDERTANSEQRILLPPRKKRASAKSPDSPPDPRHQSLVDGLDAAFKRKRGTGYPWGGLDFAVIKRLLKRRPSHEDLLWVPALLGAFERAMDATHPDCRSLEAFERDLPRYLGTGPPSGPQKGAAWTQAQSEDDRGFLEGLSDGL